LSQSRWRATALRWLVLLVVVVPVLAWFLVRPVRVLAPQWAGAGVTCLDTFLCVDAVEMLPQARSLYDEARQFVDARVGVLQGRPRLIFCSTTTCADQYGLGRRSAVTLGAAGTVIGPQAWHAYYVRHELIHHLQAQRFGVLRCLWKPQWLLEGMAYALSQDPRPVLAEPWQDHRRRFNDWLSAIGPDRLWEAADQL
jgi:hypothetical protein